MVAVAALATPELRRAVLANVFSETDVTLASSFDYLLSSLGREIFELLTVDILDMVFGVTVQAMLMFVLWWLGLFSLQWPCVSQEGGITGRSWPSLTPGIHGSPY